MPLLSPHSVDKRRRQEAPPSPSSYSSTLEALKDQLMSCLAFHKVPADHHFPFKPVQLKDTAYRIEICESEHINIVGTLWDHDLLEEKEVVLSLFSPSLSKYFQLPRLIYQAANHVCRHASL